MSENSLNTTTLLLNNDGYIEDSQLIIIPSSHETPYAITNRGNTSLNPLNFLYFNNALDRNAYILLHNYEPVFYEPMLNEVVATAKATTPAAKASVAELAFRQNPTPENAYRLNDARAMANPANPYDAAKGWIGMNANLAAGMGTMAAASSYPVVAGALNLWGAYEGLGRLTSEEGVAKTWNKFSQGDIGGGFKSLGGDAWDVLLSLPFLSKVRQGYNTASNTVKFVGRGLLREAVSRELSRMNSLYDFIYDWRTGKYYVIPKPGTAAGTAAGTTSRSTPNLIPASTRELPASTRELPASTRELPSIGRPGSELPTALEPQPPIFEEPASLTSRAVKSTTPIIDASARAHRTVIAEELPPPPPEVNIVTDGSPVEAFDRGLRPTPSPAQPASSTDEYSLMLQNNHYTRNSEGVWENAADNSRLSFGGDGNVTISGGFLFPEILMPLSELEGFLQARSSGTPYLDVPYRGLDNLITGNQHMFPRVENYGNGWWDIYHKTPDGIEFPVLVHQNGDGNIRMSVGSRTTTPIWITPETTSREVYNNIINYANSIRSQRLTDEQLALIQRTFPDQVPNIGFSTSPGAQVFTNPSTNGGFAYSPLDLTFSLQARGYRTINDAPISSLTPEIFEPVKAPTIITSREGLPAFSSLSLGADWGRILGVDPGFNALIDFGLGRPRPTIELVRQALGITDSSNSTHHGSASFYIDEYRPDYTGNMPLIETPHEVPILHLNMTPGGGRELDAADKLWLGKQMSNLSAGAKGVDIASTGNINPTVSRLVSDLSAATNLSDMDKFNILKMALENPEYFYTLNHNYGDYSPFSWLNNATLGRRPRRFFTEPSINTYTGAFNSYGSLLESPIKELFNMNPSQLGTESPGIHFTPDLAALLQDWMRENLPYLYALPLNRTKVPFPVTTFKKKGGRLVRKKNFSKLNNNNKLVDYNSHDLLLRRKQLL